MGPVYTINRKYIYIHGVLLKIKILDKSKTFRPIEKI